jgi:hypothetical protein
MHFPDFSAKILYYSGGGGVGSSPIQETKTFLRFPVLIDFQDCYCASSEGRRPQKKLLFCFGFSQKCIKSGGEMLKWGWWREKMRFYDVFDFPKTFSAGSEKGNSDFPTL